MRYFATTVLAILLSVPSFTLSAERSPEAFSVGEIKADSGKMASGFLIVPKADDVGTEIPVTVVQGSQTGPVLALIAGIHGYEYATITALQQLRQTLDPASLSGTIILVHIANPPSFLGRTIYTSPVDGKNMNRVFPGDPDGSLSERIAHLITNAVIERADYVVDLHGGDGNEALFPYIYMPKVGDDRLDMASRNMAIAFGLEHIVIDDSALEAPENSTFVDRTALSRGIPAITTETGGRGLNSQQRVALTTAGAWNLLRHLKMVPGQASMNKSVVWLYDYKVLRSPITGIFRATVEEGSMVAKDSLIGTLHDFFGDFIGEIRTPVAGFVNYVVATPPVSEGEPVAMISQTTRATPLH
ncbi:MAG: succinylglutamate desuccinylase [Halieaceae bacterium]|nr:succinylglutamate desuccinylase [Halieaceae bacterium]